MRGFFEGSRSQALRIAGTPPEPRPGPNALAGGTQHHAFAAGGASRGRGGGWGREIRRIRPIRPIGRISLPPPLRQPGRREALAITTLANKTALQRGDLL